jgi:hypothetical protein
VEHYLLECRKYIKQRNMPRKGVGAGRMRVDKLLGDPKIIKHTMEYVLSNDKRKELHLI